MAITLSANCPHCGQKHNLKPSSIDTVKKCSRCGKKFEVKLQQRSLLARFLIGVFKLAVLTVICVIVWGMFCQKKIPMEQGGEPAKVNTDKQQ